MHILDSYDMSWWGDSNLSDLVYGQSVTDSCVGLEDTEKILSMFADAVQKRRQ